MEYFQYDVLRRIAEFSLKFDLKNADPEMIRKQTGLSFAAPETHSPWRNYSRIFKLCLLISEDDGKAIPTDIARVLAQPGFVTCDEFLHFLVEATSDPSPALADWKLSSSKKNRHPLCFSLKYILAKVAGLNECVTPINEIVGAYAKSGFSGHESDEKFLGLMPTRASYANIVNKFDPRQARESIKFISQISYLNCDRNNIIASINQEDAFEIFHDLNPIAGSVEADGNAEIRRLARLFRDGSDHDFFDYKGSILTDVQESGFSEGGKVKKTHIVIERNAKLRDMYFKQYPIAVCDACRLDTNKKYPWVNRVLDLHHILPLSSGTRVNSKKGTMLDDLVAICPTCHRAIHRFCDGYLKSAKRLDFFDSNEAKQIYHDAKKEITRGACRA